MSEEPQPCNNSGRRAAIPSFGDSLIGIARLRLLPMLGRSGILKLLLTAVLAAGATAWSIGKGDSLRFEQAFFAVFAAKALPLLALVLGGGAIRSEIGDSSIEYLWTRPVRRETLVLATALSAFLSTLLYAIGASLGIFAVAFQLDAVTITFPLFRAVLAVGLSTLFFSCLATLIATMTRRYLLLGLGYFVLVEWGISQIPTNLSKIAVSRVLQDLRLVGLEWGVLYSLFFALVALGLASLFYGRTEYSTGLSKEG